MYYPQKSKFVTIISLCAILAGVIVIIGWLLKLNTFETFLPQYVLINFGSALCLVFLGTAAVLTQLPPAKSFKTIFVALSVTTAVFGLFGILKSLLHFHSIADELFVTSDDVITGIKYTYNGYTSVTTAMCTLLLGLAFLLITAKSKFLHVIGQYLLHTVTLITMVCIIGYVYGLSLFYNMGYVSLMPVYTAIFFLGISLAASLWHPKLGLANVFTGNRVGNLMARKLFLPLEFIFILLGFIRFKSQFSHLLALEVSIYLLSLILLTICLIVVTIAAIWLNRIDERRSIAESEVIALNNSLEKRVQERSAELLMMVEKYRESEHKYWSLIEHASDAIYVLDQDRNFTEVNASMCLMTGYTREELLGTTVITILEPQHLKSDPLIPGPHDLGNAVIKERRFIKKDGTAFDVEINVKKFSENRVLVIARDITARKVMEAGVKQAELKFRTLAEKSMVGIYIVQKGKFIYVNPRFAEVFGYSQQQLTDASSIDIIISQKYKAIVLENVRARMSGEVESIHYEVIGERSDGTLNWVEFYGSRVFIDEEPTIIGSMIDITERKKSGEELRLSEQKYKLLFDSNPLPMWMISRDDLSIIAVNDAATRHYGYSRDEFLMMKGGDLRLKNDWNEVHGSYTQNLSGLGDMGIFKHSKKDGSLLEVQIIAQDIVFEGRQIRLTLANDVTEKIKSEEMLQKSEANLQTILNTTNSAYALFDKNLRVVAYNQMALKFVNDQYEHTPHNGDQLSDYFPLERFPQFKQFTKQVLKGDQISYEVDYPQSNGSVFWYNLKLFPIIDSDNQIPGLMVALYDITERKNAENDLKVAYERIHKQVNSIKEVAWKQSHFMRSPIANLKGLANMLKEDPTDTDALDYIMAELNRLDTVIIDMANDAAMHEN